ncbi:MAG: AAA family ATPase [Solirubrobacterales bacterium]|nr:AAA family ATPase [Solirubrobacterales bacterium]
MQIRRLSIVRFRGIEALSFEPGERTVILGPQNAGKSTVLEALDLLLHHGLGRPRQPPTEIDYFRRAPDDGFEIEAVLADLTDEFLADVRDHLEGWNAETHEIVPEPDGEGVERIVRVRVRGTADLTYAHEFSKPESEGAFFGPARRVRIGWVFDGRARDPLRQLSFYQGGLLEKLFSGADLSPATDALREALNQGAGKVNEDNAIAAVLKDLARDLSGLGLLDSSEAPAFEAGAVSQRELLQSLRLALPAGDESIPLARQGRGAQRLVLVSVLLRLARAASSSQALIGGFEEPEEALEPLRQTQLAGMLVKIADEGGQVFVVTHSPEIARRFEIDDFLLLSERAASHDARPLRAVLTPSVRQTYERRLDGAVVRGLFAKVPVLVEGPGDRAVFDVFWRALAEAGRIRPAEELGLDVVNCEGVDGIPMLAAVLDEAGKKVVAWAERDTDGVRNTLDRLRREGHCAGLLLYGTKAGKQNLEHGLAHACSLDALAAGMEQIATDRGYAWDRQQADLLSRCRSEKARTAVTSAENVAGALLALDPGEARSLIADALGTKAVTPFEIKGGRQARILATSIVDAEGVAEPFAAAFACLYEWIQAGCEPKIEVEMWSSDGETRS